MAHQARIWTILAVAGLAAAIHRTPSALAQQPSETKTAARQIELFQAMEDKVVEVKFIAQSDRAASVIISNKTKEPLAIRLPEVFAGIPAQVAAQVAVAQPVAGGAIGGGTTTFGGGQGVGGGFGGGLGGIGGIGGGGLFNVAPEKDGRIEVNCVCLDHGKPDPRPSMEYVLVPVDKYVRRLEVVELLRAYRTGQLNHAAAQAAVWHLNNDLSWQQLAAEAIERIGRPATPYFSPAELQAGAQIAGLARRQAELVKQQTTEADPDRSLAQ